jgi:2-C-methyl-D-erythritol 4-phosphate cytidylyltransferase
VSRNLAVILAGGVGTRIGQDTPKQLINIAGRPILEHTIAAFNDHQDVDEIIVMMVAGQLDAVHDMLRSGRYPKVRHVLEGDPDTRSGTTMRALAQVDDDDAKVLLHDAVRPLVSNRIITDCFRALDEYDAVEVAIPSSDTIIEVEGDLIRSVPPRPRLWRAQTPQGFRSSVIRRAYEEAAKDEHFVATDDCSVVLRYLPDVPICVVPGEERNLKVTDPIDVYIADTLLQLDSCSTPANKPEEDAAGDKT